MNQWLTLFNKELLEMWRNFKWIWLPLVFIILGMTDPLSSYYMPIIIETVGGLPEGAVLEIPKPQANEVMLMVINQFNMLGLLIIVLSAMGTVASERKSGLAAMILVKPIPIANYITAKWASLILITAVTLFFGYLSGWYYTSILFGSIDFTVFLKSYFLLMLWFIFVLTVTLFFSAIVKVGGLAGFITLATIIVLSITTNILSDWMLWSPAQLSDSIGSIIMVGTLAEGFWLTFSSTIIIIALLITLSVKLFSKKELA